MGQGGARRRHQAVVSWLEFAKRQAARMGIVPRQGKTKMVEKGYSSRRKVLRAVFRVVSAGLLFRISQSKAAEKMTPQQAQYQDTPNGIYSCGLCTLFEAPKFCKVVEGEVSKDGWCKAFALAD
jgi:hypothetical protein